MWSHPGKKLLFMGSEFAQNDEWSHEKSLDWHLTQYGEHKGVQDLVRDLNSLYRQNPALWQRDSSSDGFTWLVGDDGAGNTLAYLRSADDGSEMISITNFSPVPHEQYHLPIPKVGNWIEALNTDDLKYGGSGVINSQIIVEKIQHRGCEYSAIIRLAPLATIYLKLN
jgi:1,4-alpha-glucan branching enzyme